MSHFVYDSNGVGGRVKSVMFFLYLNYYDVDLVDAQDHQQGWGEEEGMLGNNMSVSKANICVANKQGIINFTKPKTFAKDLLGGKSL